MNMSNPPFPFDPLLSVWHCSFASRQGNQMLTGPSVSRPSVVPQTRTPGAGFDKDKARAFTLAAKAAN